MAEFARRCAASYYFPTTMTTLIGSAAAAAFAMLIAVEVGAQGVWLLIASCFAVLLAWVRWLFERRAIKADEEDHLSELTEAIREVLFQRGVWLLILDSHPAVKLSGISGLVIPDSTPTLGEKLEMLRLFYPQICEKLELFPFSESYQRDLEYYGSPLLFQRTKSAFPKVALFRLWQLALGRAVEAELLDSQQTDQGNAESSPMDD